MAGLDPAIHVFSFQLQDVDAWHKAGHDEFILSDRFDYYPHSVARLRDRPHLPVRPVVGRLRHLEALQSVPCETFRLYVGEMQAEAHMRAARARHPGEAMAVALR